MCIFKAIVTSVGMVGGGRESLELDSLKAFCFLSVFLSPDFLGIKRKDFSDSLAKHLIRGGNEKSS